MNELIDKLTTEKNELINRIDKLNIFMRSEEYRKLGRNQQMLLNLQLNLVNNYIDILNYRIIDLRGDKFES